ncbi:cytoplasmic tRNA 2-thiolation protein 2-A-like [Oculina patagonica]
MCSVQEEDLENVPSELQNKASKEKNRQGRTCMKCSISPAVVVVRLNDPLCKSCFMAYFTHKFRATIGKARAIRAGEKVLLAFSGGPSSSSMLHLVCEGLSGTAPKKLRFEPGVAFIDEGEVLKHSGEERSKYIQQIRNAATRTKFPFHQLNLEDIFVSEKYPQDDAMSCKKFERPNSGTNQADKLRNLFDATSSMTAKEDLLRTLRSKLLLMTARNEGYSKVMLADCATRISVRLLSDVSQGRGGDLPYDTGFSDDRHGDVSYIRPMREFMTKEIALYNFFNNVETVLIPTLGTMSQSHASIDRLTEDFVSGLQADLPFTVSTIFRTGDKLSVKESSEDVTACALCGVPMNVDPTLLSTLTDSLSAAKLGDDNKSTPKSASDCCGGCDSGCSTSPSEQQLTKDNILDTFCYGCRLTYKDTKFDVSDLPSFVLEAASKVHHRAQMKEQIKDFLLDE